MKLDDRYNVKTVNRVTTETIEKKGPFVSQALMYNVNQQCRGTQTLSSGRKETETTVIIKTSYTR